jgi:BarA-like signal transduction histidine kinase
MVPLPHRHVDVMLLEVVLRYRSNYVMTRHQ